MTWLLTLTALAAQGTAPLAPGMPVERQLKHGEIHEYPIVLEAGRYARVVIEQHNIDVGATVVSASGETLVSLNNFPSGRETVEWIATQPGPFVLRLSSPDSSALPGRYTMLLDAVEPATATHQSRVASARAFSQGMSVWGKQSPDHLQQAVSHARAAHDPSREAMALYHLGMLAVEDGDKQKALDFSTQALAVARQCGDSQSEAWALNILGNVENEFADKRKAVEYFNQALPLMRAAKDGAGEGAVLNNLGTAHARLGDKRRALEYFKLAAQIFSELQIRRRLATIIGNIGVTHSDLGEYQQALEYQERALALRREIGNRGGEAIALNNIGAVWSNLADYQKALDAYTAALEIQRSLGHRWNVAICLHNIAWVYRNLGDRDRALDHYQQALAILREVKDQGGAGNTLSNIAEIHASNGDVRKALEVHTEALACRRGAGDADGEAASLNHIAKVLARLGEKDKARDHFERAIAILRASGDRSRLAGALRNYGAFHRSNQDLAGARERLDEAIAITRLIHDRRGEADTLTELALLDRDAGDVARAQKNAEAALCAFESLRLTVASPRMRASFFAAAREAQELDIEMLMRLHAARPREGYDAAAFLVNERGRARTLLELLGESGVEIREGVDGALVARERELERSIASKAGQNAMARELDTLAAELEQVQARIRQTSPRYAALTHPSPLRLDEIQSKVLDQDTVLLEYALGSGKSYLWAVTAGSVDVFELPGRAEIEAAVREVYDLLTARNRRPASETASARGARINKADQAYLAAARKVSRMLLEPAAGRLGRKRLWVIGEGVLHYLPFGALPDPAVAEAVPLVVNHELVTAPSASVLAAIRREAPGRKPADKTLAVLADPVFSPADARIAGRIEAPSADGMRSGAQFTRLRFTRQEAEAITRLASTGDTMKALDFDASRDTVLSPDFARYRIVHFATHSLLDNRRPELSGVVLSLVDAAGKPRNGFLRLYDVYNLKLGADLVVLSACQTALGGEIKGEGLIGLTRGFLYAGAPRVVATLWEADDRTAAELMKRFYEGILTRGERPAAALRSAQIATWKTAGWDQPYYWAAFILQGEWQ